MHQKRVEEIVLLGVARSSRLSLKSIISFLHHQFKFHTTNSKNKTKKSLSKKSHTHAHAFCARRRRRQITVEIRARTLALDRARKDDDDDNSLGSFERFFVRALFSFSPPRFAFRATTPKPPFSRFQKEEME